jgi:hypothetical protein
VIDDEESVSEVFTFSELTLVVTSHRLVKHVGATVWDDDFEVYPYSDVTGLSFEEGSVATQVVLSVGGRPERIKAPSDHARRVERTLKQALFSYHGVDSLTGLNGKVAPEEQTHADTGGEGENTAGSLALDESISPLVGGSDDESDSSSTGDTQSAESATASTTRGESSAAGNTRPDDSSTDTRPGTSKDPTPASEESRTADSTGTGDRGASEPKDTAQTDVSVTEDITAGSPGEGSIDPDDIEMMKKQLSTLTTAVKKQNKLLRDQQETIDTLIEELRRGR